MTKVLVTAPPPDLKAKRRDVPDGLAQIIGRMLLRDKQERYASLRQVGADLERGAATTAGPDRLTPVISKRGLPPWLWGVGGLIVIGVLAGAVLLGSSQAPFAASPRASLTLAPTPSRLPPTPRPTREIPADTPVPEPLVTPTGPSPEPVAPTPSRVSCNGDNQPASCWRDHPVNFQRFFFATASTGFAVGWQPDTLLRTKDGGSTWSVLPFPSTLRVNAVYFLNASTGWLAGDQGTLWQTTDGGDTWQPRKSGTMADLYRIEFWDARIGWIGGANGILLRTTDGGLSWSRGATGSQADIVELAFVDAQKGFLIAHTRNGPLNYILQTLDGGATWENTAFWGTRPEAMYAAEGMPVWIVGGWVGGSVWKGIGHDSETSVLSEVAGPTCGGARFRQVFFSDDQHGWIVGDCGLALWTQDGGQSWIPMEVDAEADWKMLRFLSKQEAVLAGYSSTDGLRVYHSSDGGLTWQPAGASR